LKRAQTLLLFFVFFMLCTRGAAADEPRVHVETYPQWTAGPLAIYLLDFPGDGATYSRDTIRIRVAVWGATEINPIQILLDGEEAARIEGPGMFVYEWSLRGSHHLLIRCSTKIFQQAGFNVKAPPPPPPTIQLDEFYRRLEEQRSQMMLAMVAATVVGVPVGIGFKKRTKVTTVWAAVPMGAAVLAGVRWLPDLYMLVPLGLSAGMVYWLAREYADYMAISVIEEGGIDTDVLPLDDEGRAIKEVGPRYWRTRFMHVKRIELVDNRYPVNFRFKGTMLRCITVAGRSNIQETEDQIRIKCSPALARGLAESKVIEDLENKLADTRFKLVFMERALRSVVSQAIQEMEQIIEDQMLDQMATIPEARERVAKATEMMKRVLEPPPEEMMPEVSEAGEG